MKRIMFLGISAIALLFSNCSNEEVEGGKASLSGELTTITASFEGNSNNPATKTTVDNTYHILWSKGDAFKLFYQEEDAGPDKFTLEGEGGTSSGDFIGTVEGDKTPVYAVYPVQDGMTIANNVLTMKIPSEIQYSENANGPMLSKVIDGNTSSLYFTHLAAMIKLTVNKIPDDATTLILEAEGVNDGNIAGTCTATLTDEKPQLSSKVDASDISKTITVTFNANSSATKSFYIPLLSGTYQKLTAKMTNGTKTYFTKTKENKTLNRADILVFPDLDVTTINGSTTAAVTGELGSPENEEIIKNAATNGVPVNIALTETINTTQGSNEPLQLPMVDNAQLNMTFKEAPTTTTDQPLTIKEKTTATGANTLTVAIPSVADDKAPSLTVELPKTTVTLATTDAQTTYNKVVATTAENTLIVDKGVTVKELVIKGGNVKIYGTVEKLSRDGANQAQSTIVEVYDAGDIRVIDRIESFAINSVWDGAVHPEITLPEISNGSIPIYTAAQFATLQSKNIPAKVPAGGLPFTVKENVSLHTDIDLKENPWIGMVLGEEKTFDGNNHSVSNLTIKKFILDQQLTTYTPDACVGLFAAAYKNSVIKNITVKDVKIVGDEVKNAKWVGALVGFSQGVKEYTNCKSENVTIELLGTSAVRVGGLIGYIEKSHATLEPSVVLTNCSVKNANIIASYSYGGLVGSLYDAVKFDGCKTEGITLGLGNATSNYGYVSKFIGDVTNSTTHSRKVIFKDCTTEDLTDPEKAALGFDNIAMKGGKKYVGGCKYVGIVDYVEQMTLIEEINGESRTLQNGEDFNKYEN